LRWLVTNSWKAIGALLVALAITGVYQYGKTIGAAQCRSEALEQAIRKTGDAIKAQSDSIACSNDPTCRVQSDGYRRD